MAGSHCCFSGCKPRACGCCEALAFHETVCADSPAFGGDHDTAGGRPVRLEVAVAPGIDEGSWLHGDDPEFEAFKAGYAYARNHTRAIGPLSKLTPEETYDVWSAVQRGVERADPQFRVTGA
jgi:hypothetical protein